MENIICQHYSFCEDSSPIAAESINVLSIDEFARRAVRYNRLDLVREAIRAIRALQPPYKNWHDLIEQAVMTNNQELFDYIFNQAPANILRWDVFAVIAAEHCYQQLFINIKIHCDGLQNYLI